MPKEITIREQFLFKKIDWAMKEFNLETFCRKMNWEVSKDSTDTHICTFCPDHFHYTGKTPSHPKFFIDRKTGETFCATEDRGSNLIWTVKRVLDCTATEAYRFVTGKEDIDSLTGVNWKLLLEKIHESQLLDQDTEELEKNSFEELEAEISEREVYDDGYEFFIKPEGKKPTNISRETVDHFKVFQRNYGFYKNRVIIPSFLKQKITGFVAIDIKGFNFWKLQNPEADEKDYKKVRYNKGFKARQNLFNFDDIEYGAKYIIMVEGARDVMKLWQLGFKNAVAIFGKHLSNEHCQMLSEKYPEMIYTMFDGDDAGYTATRQICKKLASFIDARGVVLPRGVDPKNLNTCEEVNRLLNKALVV